MKRTNHDVVKGNIMENEVNNNKKDKLIIKYQNDYYDLTKFIKKHPGGYNTLIDLNHKDIGKKMEYSPPHSNAAMYLMKEYKMKKSFINGIALLGDEQSEVDLNGNGYIKENDFGFDSEMDLINDEYDVKYVKNDSVDNDIADTYDESMEVSVCLVLIFFYFNQIYYSNVDLKPF